MKKTAIYLLTIIISLVCFSIPCFSATADFSDPVPIGVDTEQHKHPGDSATYSTQTDAVRLKFFDHPDGGDPNFEDSPSLLGTDDTVIVHDLVGTPGLMPEPYAPVPPTRLETLWVLLEEMIPFEWAGAPVPSTHTHAFCPDEINFTRSDPALSQRFLIECNVSGAGLNRTDHELQVADIRKPEDETEFHDLIGEPALANNVIGSAQYSLNPYETATYPTTLNTINRNAFFWPAVESTVEYAYSDGGPIPSTDNLNEVIRGLRFHKMAKNYTHVLNYGLTDLGEALLTASYDPVNIEKVVRINQINSEGNRIGGRPLDPWIPGLHPDGSPVDTIIYTLLRTHLSPLMLFNKQEDTLKLSGYSSLNFKGFDYTHPNQSLNNLIWDVLLSQNFNTIAVEKVGNRIAVVNQGTLGRLNECFKNFSITPEAGECLLFGPDGDGIPINWRTILGTNPDYPAPGGFSSLTTNQLPHDLVSYVTFWYVDDSGDIRNYYPMNFSLIGSQVYSAAVARDVHGGTGGDPEKIDEFLIVASGASAEIPGDPDRYYLYKISPLRTEDNAIYFNPTPRAPSTGMQTPGILADVHQITPPEGFVPYEVKTANFNGDACDDVVLTWRGKEIIKAEDDAEFNNDYNEHVYFKRSGEANNEMFSNCFTIYIADPATECSLDKGHNICFPAPGDGPARQITSVVIDDFTEDGVLDILAGDLIPRATIRDNEYTGYAIHCKGLNIAGGSASCTEQEPVRIGFKTTEREPADANYLIDIARDVATASGYRAGVAHLQVDADSNVGAILGLPLMLPSMGCPSEDNIDVSSAPEIYKAMAFEALNPGIARDGRLTESIVPMSCLPSALVTAIEGDGSGSGGGLPRIDLPAGRIDGEGLLREVYPRSSDDDAHLNTDKIYDPSPSYIADASDLVRVALTVIQNKNDILDKATLPINQNPTWQNAFVSFLSIFDSISSEQAKIIVDTFETSNDLSVQIIKPFIMSIFQSAITPKDETDTSAHEVKKEDSFSLLDLFISKAYADEVEEMNSFFRMPRGHTMPGLREMTVVIADPLAEDVPPRDGDDCDCDLTTDLRDCTADDPEGACCDDDPDTEWPACEEEGGDGDGDGDGDFRDPCPPCDCEDCCCQCRFTCTPPVCDDPPCGNTCSLSAQKIVKMKCVGGSDARNMEAIDELNRKVNSAIRAGGGNINSDIDLFCEAGYGTMKMWVNVSDAAVPGTSVSGNIMANVSGNVRPAALIHLEGPTPKDFTSDTKKPLNTDMTTSALLLPGISSDIAADISMVFPDLSLAGPAYSAIAPMAPNLITNYDVTNNTFVLNNVVRWEIATASTYDSPLAARPDELSVVHLASMRLQPETCTLAAHCPESEAVIDPSKALGRMDFDKVIQLAYEHGMECSEFGCSRRFFDNIGMKNIFIYSEAIGQTKNDGTLDITPYNFAAAPSGLKISGGTGAGCGKCNLNSNASIPKQMAPMALVIMLLTGIFLIYRRHCEER